MTTFDTFIPSDFISLDDALGELTELMDQRDYHQMMRKSTVDQLENIRNGLNEFVKENHGATDATALIEALCEEFALDATRRVSATVNVQFTVYVDAPYTKTIDEVEEDIAGLDYKCDTRYNNGYDYIDVVVEDVSVDDISED